MTFPSVEVGVLTGCAVYPAMLMIYRDSQRESRMDEITAEVTSDWDYITRILNQNLT